MPNNNKFTGERPVFTGKYSFLCSYLPPLQLVPEEMNTKMELELELELELWIQTQTPIEVQVQIQIQIQIQINK